MFHSGPNEICRLTSSNDLATQAHYYWGLFPVRPVRIAKRGKTVMYAGELIETGVRQTTVSVTSSVLMLFTNHNDRFRTYHYGAKVMSVLPILE